MLKLITGLANTFYSTGIDDIDFHLVPLDPRKDNSKNQLQ